MTEKVPLGCYRYIVRCIPAIGGGLYRYAIQHCFDYHTDKWNQEELESLQPGATIVPLIISMDKTQLTVFGGKMAYPVYITIRNIPKEICQKLLCHAQMLISYIPTSKLEGIKNKAACHHALTNLFHFCMQLLLAPIVSHGKTGVPMMSGDGTWHQCYPILANSISDYPEQVLVACTYYSKCPKCEVKCNQLGNHTRPLACNYRKVINSYALADSDTCTFCAACKDNGIKLVFHPFWELLLLANIYILITPDILYQMLQGVMKHLIAWLSDPLVFRP